MNIPIPKDLGASLLHNASTAEGDPMKCCLCSTPYQRGDLDFYRLCPGCFSAFDWLKMQGRFGKGAPCESVQGNEQRIRDASESLRDKLAGQN